MAKLSLIILVCVSVMFSAYSGLYINTLNKFGLSINPIVFSDDFFFYTAEIKVMKLGTIAAKLNINDLFPYYKPLPISRARYLVITRFFKKNPKYINFNLQNICEEKNIPDGYSLQLTLKHIAILYEHTYACKYK